MCHNDQGKAINLPVDYLFRAMADGRRFTLPGGRPLAIESLGYQELITVKTNYSTWHELTVGETTELARWQDGAETTPASKCVRVQLLGMYGMYVVTQASRTMADAYRCNAEIIGGVYVGKRS
jgi:hypothetical protein